MKFETMPIQEQPQNLERMLHNFAVEIQVKGPERGELFRRLVDLALDNYAKFGYRTFPAEALKQPGAREKLYMMIQQKVMDAVADMDDPKESKDRIWGLIVENATVAADQLGERFGRQQAA